MNIILALVTLQKKGKNKIKVRPYVSPFTETPRVIKGFTTQNTTTFER